jgi:fused signal recognition particle receptor
LGNKIRQWIKNGRPKPDESNDVKNEEIQKPDKEEKPEKKRGRFGFLRK